MKVVQINTFPNKATGNIMMNIHKYLIENGHESYVVWGRGRRAQNKYEICMSTKLDVIFHVAYTRIFDRTGFASWHATKQLLKKIDKINPDIIHLHNIHGYYINIKLLFKYIKEKKKNVVWTLHDCWPLTGHCAYFDMIGCDKWISCCHDCVQVKSYPSSLLIDNSKWNYNEKKELFSGCNMILVSPSNWLKRLIELSFLKNYPVYVIPNGIDTSIFKFKKSNFKKEYGIQDKFVILGVASEWTERKGLKDFIKLNDEINKQSDEFKIVLVGLTKEQKRRIPKYILGLERTNNVNELVEIYSAADLFFNPTYEDNFPTTNLEAIACETPVLTYDTGGCIETINNSNSFCVQTGDLEACLSLILKLKKKTHKEHNIFQFNLRKMLINYDNLYRLI